jgi:hypothetical protein
VLPVSRLVVTFDGGVVDFDRPSVDLIRWARDLWRSDATAPTIQVANVERPISVIRYVAEGGRIDWEWAISNGSDI